MRTRTLSVIELFNLFPHEQAAREWFELVRWNHLRHCPNPNCESARTYRVPEQYAHALPLLRLPQLLLSQDRHGVTGK